MPDPFAELPPTPETHFQLCSYAAMSHLLMSLARSAGSVDAVVQAFPFLSGYRSELKARGLDWPGLEAADAWWDAALRAWEAGVMSHLPLRALRRAAALDHQALTLFIVIGLVEEDPSFGQLFAACQNGPELSRPTTGLLAAMWPVGAARRVRGLQQMGLVYTSQPEAPHSQQALLVPGPIWEAARGECDGTIAPWAQYRRADQLIGLEDLLLPAALSQTVRALPRLLAAGDASTIVVRGPRHNGRHTLLGALARTLGRGVLEVEHARHLDPERLRMIGPLAALLHALPVLAYELAPGESIEMGELDGLDSPLGLVLGQSGGLTGSPLERAVTLAVGMPDQGARRAHWQRAASAGQLENLDQLSEQFRLTAGNIYRVAPLAQAQAALAGHPGMTPGDVRQACRALHQPLLEVLATRLETFGDWSRLSLSQDTRGDLLDLAARCRQRERLPGAAAEAFGSTVNAGVRALFTGPSGTGKTLAARVLAAQLEMDIYRLDLSAAVNKYIGETEKNLNQVFSRAEELDVILLIDEGDALLTQRTSVSNSNDRYANLETNFLLQRLESFGGIVIVTTNSSERIDRAFQRRMDVVVDFHPPEAAERWLIWQLHLPQPHAVDEKLLSEVVTRCVLTGGQIRNAALHATLLAINNGGMVTSGYLREAVKREYRQSGAVCPLRSPGLGPT